jgi:hypothetical protein
MAKAKAIPKNLATVADMYYMARRERLAAEKIAKALQQDEQRFKTYLIDNLPKSKIGGVIGKVAQVEIKKKSVPRLADRKKFYAYVRRTEQHDLVTESMNTKAVQERWDAGKTVPGVEKFDIVTLSLKTVKTKR